MGIILSRVRKKKSRVETLEKLDNDIKEIEENRVSAQRKYKQITKLLLIYTVGLYILCGAIFYFQYTSTLQGKLLYLVPLALSPLLLYVVKRVISWYFVRLLSKNEKRLNDMRKEKKRILEEVMNTETYKVAKEILDKFSNEPVIKPSYNMQLSNQKKVEDVLRRRTVPPAASAPVSQMRFPSPPNRPLSTSPMPSLVNSTPYVNRAMSVPSTPAMHMPAPILPLQRSYVDRIVEYLIGDGPNNRYALICSKCHSHNGMALKEEFEYIGFKCCYCYFYNPARKIRPEAPRLETPSRLNQDSDSDSERTSGENSDLEPKPGKPVNEIEDTNSAIESAVSESLETVEGTPENVRNSVPDLEKRSEERDAEKTEEEKEKDEQEEVGNSNHSHNDVADCDESVVES